MRRPLMAGIAILAVVAVVVMGVPPVVAADPPPECTVKWDGSAGTPHWYDAANWNTDTVPGDSDIVCIDDGFYVAHTTGTTILANLQVDGNLTVAGGSIAAYGASHVDELDVTGGTLVAGGEFTVTHALAWTGGTIGAAGQGVLVVGVGATASMFNADTKTLTGPLRNDGTLTWSGGSLQMASGGDPHLDNHGTLKIDGAVTTSPSQGEDLPRFTNRPGATITKTGAGEAVFGDQRATFVNDGTVTVSGGTLRVDMWLDGFGGADLNSGTWEVADGATLKLHAADLSTNSANISLLGPGANFLDGSGSDALDHLATNAGSLTLTGGRDLVVSGQFANDGTLHLGPGSELSVAGDFYAGNGRIELDVAGLSSDSHGRVSATGTAWLGGTLAAGLVGPFVPAPTDEFEVISATSLSGTVATVEGGLFVVYDPPNGRVLLTPTEPAPGCDATFDGGGGTELWGNPANWSSGTLPGPGDVACISEGRSVNFLSGTATVGAIRAEGYLQISDGTLEVQGESTIHHLHLGGGTLTGSGDVTVTGELVWYGGTLAGTGTLTLAPGASGDLQGSLLLSRHLRNEGTMDYSGASGSIGLRTDMDGAAHLDNAGTFNLTGTVATNWIWGTTPPQFTNRPGATIVKSGPWTTTATFGSGDFSNEGTVRVEDGGTLTINASVAQISGTTLTGGTWEVVEGTLMVRGLSVVTNQAEIILWGCCNLLVDENYDDAVRGTLVVNQGTLSLHRRGLDVAPGFGNSGTIRLDPWSSITGPDGFSQSAAGRLVTEISGFDPNGSNGAIETNLASLDGVLESVLVPPDGQQEPYEPSASDEFKVIRADALIGTFSSVEGPLAATYDTAEGDVLLSLGGSPTSCNVEWDGSAGDGRWDTAANWSTDAVPGANDWVCIPEGATANHVTGASAVAAVTAPGTLRITDGTLSINGDSSVTDLQLAGGTLDGTGGIDVQDQFTWSGGNLNGTGDLTLVGNATGSVSGSVGLSRHLVNQGTLVWQSGTVTLNDTNGVHAHLDNHATFEIRSADNAYAVCCSAHPTITNRPGATITKTTAGITTLGSGNTEFVNDGTIGIGFASTLSLGGTFNQGSTGRLDLSLAGTSPGTAHARFLVSGVANLDGTIATTAAGGFEPSDGDEFLVLDASSLSGTFATVDSPLTPRYDTAAGTVTLVDEEIVPVLPTVTISPQSAPESAGMFLVEVRGVGGNMAVEVPFAVVAGTAQAADDYSTLFTPATVTVNPDASSFVPVMIVADAIDEDDETFTVTAGTASAPVTILDDDLRPVAVVDGLSITEPDEGTVNAPVTVRLVDPVTGLLPQVSGRDVVVATQTHDGTAVAGSDYVETVGNVVFAPGETAKVFDVPIVGEEVDEDDEQFTVTISPAGNVTVQEDESATITIVNDDGPGGTGTVAEQLETGGGSLFDVLDEWGDEYDLDRSAPSPFELPGLTDELASLYEPQDDLDALESPFAGLDDDFEALCGQLEARGLSIDWVEGGACGYPAPPAAEDIIQIRYTASLADLTEAAGFNGDEFNDDAERILDGLASQLGLDADFDSSADLIVTLVVGVDEAGFYVADESGLRLEIGATATVNGTGDVGGIDGLSLSGPVDVDVAVLLGANGGASRLRVTDLAGSPAAYLRPAAEGTVGLHLDAGFDPVELAWDSTFTLEVDSDFETTIDVDARLEGTLTLPGLTEAGDPAEFDLVGTYDSGMETWTLTGEGASGAEYALRGFDVEELGFTIVLTPEVFSGTASLSLKADLGGPETPLTLDCDGAFDHSVLHAECHLALDEANISDNPTLVHLHGATVDAVFDGDIATGDMSGGVDVAAATLVVLPEPAPTGQVPEGAARAENVTGSLDTDGNLALHAGLLTGSIGGKIDFSAAEVDFSLGPDATGPVFAVDTVTATIPSLNGLGVTFSGFHLNRDGTFGAESISVASEGFLQTIGLAGILPFDITEVEVEFPDHEDLDSFDVAVTGHFDFASMAALPFTPVIGLGGDPVTPSSPPEDNIFTFTIAVDSLSEGQVRPWDLGPITLGFDDLEVGDVTLGAQLTLGAYADGEWVDDFGGSLSIEGGLDDIAGEATIDVAGALDITSGGAALDLSGTFSISADLSEDIRIEGASLDFALGVAVDDQWQFTISGPTFDGAGVDRIEVAFGEFMRLVGTNVGIDFDPAPGQPLVAVGGQPCDEGEIPPCDGSAAVEFDDELGVLAGWGGEAGHFAIDADLTPRVLPGFFLSISVPDDERFGLPDWLPVRIDEIGIRFPNVDLGNIPPEGTEITDLADFAIRFSGGIEANETWPISAAVDGLEVDLGKLVRGEFPITNLVGFEMGVEPFELAPGFEIGGGLELKTIDVDGDPAPGEQTETVFYGRIFGQFEYEGFGAGIDLVVTEYGPVLAQVLVPVGVPIDGGLLGGVILSGVEGGLKFGGPAFPDPDSPLDILHDPAFDTDFPVNEDTIRDSVEPAVQNGNLTWDSGFTVALSGKLTHAMAPAIVSGDVTIGMNVGLIPGQQGVKFIGSGDISVWGMEFAGAALLIDLQNPLEPKFDYAFETPQPGNPLGFLLPAQAQLTASLDTTGIIPGFALGVATFVDRVVHDGVEVGQDFFVAALDALAMSLEGDHTRPLARLLLDTSGDGLVSSGEDQQVITREFLTPRAIALMGGGGLPADSASAGRAARMFVADLLSAGSDLLDDFDLSAVFTHADYAAFAELLGAGGESIAALFGVVRDAVQEAGDAFLSQFDPSFHLMGMLQPIILGIPFGEPQHQVELIISKDGLGFGFDTSIGDIGIQLCDLISPVISGAICRLMTLGFEDHLGMTFELPIGGILEGLFGGSGVPRIDPMSGDWAIELRGGLRWLDFEVGQMSGLVVAADNPAFLDAHVQKLWEHPDAPLDPSRIPIQTEAHYLDIVDHGGILLTGRLLLPELLTDPVGLLSEVNLAVPDNILDMPDWIAGIADHLGRTAQPASVQLFMPGFGEVFEFAFDAATEAERISPIGTGQALADAFNDVSQTAYIEGTFDGTLLSLPFGKAVVTAQDQKLSVDGVLPLLGLRSRFQLDVKPTLGTDGVVDLPRAIATTTIDEVDVDDVLARFGLPPLFSGVAGVDATFRAVSPGYDPSSSDPLLRAGGIEISSRLRIAGVVNNARYTMKLSPNGDIAASAGVTAFTPVPDITLRNATVGFAMTGGSFQGNLAGTVNLSGWLAAALGVTSIGVTGSFDSDGNVSLSFTLNGVTYDLIELANASVDEIVDLLVSLGRDLTEIAEFLYENVTGSVSAIVDQLVRLGATYLDIVQALYGSVTNSLRTLVTQLLRIGASFTDIASALDQGTTATVSAIINAIDDFTNASLTDLVNALEAMGTTTLGSIINLLEAIGYSNFANIAAALDAATGFSDSDIINAIDDFTAASLRQLIDALEAMGRTTLSQLINMLEAIGYSNFANIAAALDAATGFSDSDIINAIDDFTTASLTTLVNALEAMGNTALGTIIDMLEAIGYTNVRQLATALDDATSATFRQIANALDDYTTASFNAIGDALRYAGASYATIVDALDWATNATVNQMADAIRYAGASFTSVMRALEAELNVDRYDTAAQLQRLGASITQILNALVAVYNAGYDSLVNVLVSLGLAVQDAIAVVLDFLDG